MAPGRSLRSGASLAVALVLVASLSSGAAAAQSGNLRTGSIRPAVAKKELGSQLKLTDRTAQSRHSVNVRRLATKKPAKRPVATLPRLGLSGTASGSKPNRTPKLVGPPPPTDATTNGDPAAAQSSFPGLAMASGPTNGEPPDPWVAVGPEHVVQAVNLELKFTDRQGVDLGSVSLPDFFGLPTNPVTFDSDPHVIYDSLHGRWLATEVSWDCDQSGGNLFGTGYIDFAVSRTTDPTGTWDTSYITFNDKLPDYPAPGTSTDKVAFTSNVFDMAAGTDCVQNLTFAGGDVLYADWTDVLDRNGAALKELISPLLFTPRAAVQVPATSATMQTIVGLDDGLPGSLSAFYLTTVGSVVKNTLVIDAFWNLTADDVVSGFTDPPEPTQPGGDIAEAVDLRPTDAVWQGNRLVYVSTYPCSGQDCVRVTELDTTGADATHEPSLTQDFLIGESGKDDYMGGVGLTGNGTLHIGWTRSSSTAGDFPSSYSAHQVPGDAPGSISAPEVLGAGTGPYPGSRWGDYVGIAQDPQVPNQAWDANEFSAGAPGWATKVTRLQTAGTTYVPIAAVRVLDTRHNVGLNGAFTANTSRTWPVAGVGGIDPDAVAVTGNLTVTGQTAAGFVAVTVNPTTNPPSSTINFPLGQTRANNVTIPLSATGTLSAVYKGASGKKTGLVFDVTGYFLADDSGATFSTVGPVRALDTRHGVGLSGPFSANVARTLVIGGSTPGIPTTAIAITGNLTVVSPTKAGYAAVTKDLTNTPSTSTINFPAAVTRANGVFAPLDASHALSIVYKAAAGGKANILLDITGYFEPGTAGLRFVPMAPSRIMDSRSSAVLSGIHGTFSSGSPKTLPIAGHWGVPATAHAVIGNLTVTGQTAGGFVSATPFATTNPPTSTINFVKGDTMANGIVAPLNPSGNSAFVYKGSAGQRTDLILDLSGYFE